LRILVVEDDLAVRESLTGFFSGKKPPHELTWVSTGRGALEAMHHQTFDFIILDMILDGGMTGWDVAYVKHQDPNFTCIPFVIMTGMTTDNVHLGAHTHRESIQAAKCILQKPLDFKILDHVIRAVEVWEPVTAIFSKVVPAAALGKK
jgi:CheY-like chemotaxis protein